LVWEKRQLVLDAYYYEENVSKALDAQLRGLQLDEPTEHKEEEEIGH
jgi:hypothetical protein